MELSQIQERASRLRMVGPVGGRDAVDEVLLAWRDVARFVDVWQRGHRAGLVEALAAVVVRLCVVCRMSGYDLPAFDVAPGSYDFDGSIPPSREAVQRETLLLVRELVKVGEACWFEDRSHVTMHVDGALTCVTRLARMFFLDLEAAIEQHLAAAEAGTERADA